MTYRITVDSVGDVRVWWQAAARDPRKGVAARPWPSPQPAEARSPSNTRFGSPAAAHAQIQPALPAETLLNTEQQGTNSTSKPRLIQDSIRGMTVPI